MEEKEILTVEVVDIQFRPGQKVYYFAPDGKVYHNGDHVIIDTARGPEYGICTAGNHKIPAKEVISPLRCVLRVANDQDEKVIQENRAKEKKAYEVCQQKIQAHGLDMQLVSAECAFDGSKILFFFTADERVDFRELVKNLASVFHTRIELRQIGVRDKAKMVGGLGICGRPFCCASFLDDFQPVSIKMAKTQNLSLNPVKISGTCGRLMCCLKYEQDAYEDLLRNAPKAESFVDTPEGRGTIVEVDLLRQRVKVRMEEQPETISSFHNDEIAVLRSGKAKKNDPPIPADLAPISGNGKRQRREEDREPAFLDPIKFRYSSEEVVEPVQQSITTEQEEPTVEKEKRQRRSRNRNRRAENGSAHEETPKAPQKTERPKPEQAKKEPAEDTPEAKKNSGNHRRRRSNYRRKPKQSGNAAE